MIARQEGAQAAPSHLARGSQPPARPWTHRHLEGAPMDVVPYLLVPAAALVVWLQLWTATGLGD